MTFVKCGFIPDDVDVVFCNDDLADDIEEVDSVTQMFWVPFSTHQLPAFLEYMFESLSLFDLPRADEKLTRQIRYSSE